MTTERNARAAARLERAVLRKTRMARGSAPPGRAQDLAHIEALKSG